MCLAWGICNMRSLGITIVLGEFAIFVALGEFTLCTAPRAFILYVVLGAHHRACGIYFMYCT